MFELTYDIALLLIFVAFIAGFLDSIAGGGGLFVLPALLLSGIPPIQALATNKVQALFGTGMATFVYWRKGHIKIKEQLPWAVVSFLCSVAGALAASSLPTDFIRLSLPFVLIGIALFFLLNKNLDDTDRKRRMSVFWFGATFVPCVGFYDGIIGPGTGSFFMLGFITLAGYGVLKATAHTKLLNFASNVGGLMGFLMVLSPIWSIGLLMGAAQVAGASLGSSLAHRVGARIIKPLIVFSSSALAIKLIIDTL